MTKKARNPIAEAIREKFVLGYWLLILGGGLLAAGLLTSYLITVFSIPGEGLNLVVRLLQEKAIDAGAWCLVAGLFGLFIGGVASNLWEQNIQPTFISGLKSYQEENARILKVQKLSEILAETPAADIRELLPEIHTRAYGSHCGSQNGLYSNLQSKLLHYLDPAVPHRSNQRQHILIEEENGQMSWTESVSYELHTVCLDGDYSTPSGSVREIPYEFTYETSGLYVDLDRVSLKITIGESAPIDIHQHLELTRDQDGNIIDANSSDDSLQVTKLGEHLRLSYKKQVQVTTHKLKILIAEKSYLSLEDCEFVGVRSQPSCGSMLSITIPKGWEFVSFILPGTCDWSEPSDTPHMRIASTNGWVLPGIVVSCKWKRPL